MYHVKGKFLKNIDEKNNFELTFFCFMWLKGLCLFWLNSLIPLPPRLIVCPLSVLYDPLLDSDT